MVRRSILFFFFLAGVIGLRPAVAQMGEEETRETRFDKLILIGSLGGNIVGNDFTKASFSSYLVRPVGTLTAEYYFTELFGIYGSVFGGTFGTQMVRSPLDPNSSSAYNAIFFGGYVGPVLRLDPIFGDVRPIVTGILGNIGKKTTVNRALDSPSEDWNPIFTYGIGVGMEFFLTGEMYMRPSFSVILTNSDELDGIKQGKNRDGFSMLNIALCWHPSFGKGEGEADLEPAEIPVVDRPRDMDSSQPALRISTKAQVVAFSSLSALMQAPDQLLLMVRKSRGRDASAVIHTEILTGGQVIASGSRSVVLRRLETQLDAEAFIDFPALSIASGYSQDLPQGLYSIRITTEAEGAESSAVSVVSFNNVDVSDVFRENTPKVQQMIVKGEAVVVHSDTNEVVMRVFTPESEEDLSAPKTADGTDSAEDGVQRNPASSVPDYMPDSERRTYLSLQTQQSFQRARILRRLAQDEEKGKNPPSIIVSEVYFPYDNSQLTEEGKAILDQVASELMQNPNLGVQVRGYSDEVGDEVYNQSLAQQRATRVVEYLTRQRVPSQRLTVVAVGRPPRDGEQQSSMQRRYRKAEVMILGY